MPETVIIHNPTSGRESHADTIRSRAALLGYPIERTDEAGDAVRLAREAAEVGASTVVAAGGDGTVNEVVQGLDRADAFADATLGVLPVGTGNNFAEQIGIPDLSTGFDVLEDGDRRRIDLGRATDHPFVNSCVAGLTADSSSETSSDMKSRIGALAYVVTTLRSLSDYESLRLTIEGSDEGAETADWTGEALGVLIGNGRRFTTAGSEQAHMEDGLFDVAVIKDVATLDLMSDTVLERLFGQGSEHIVRSRTSALTVRVHDPAATVFSLDGEIIRRRKLSLTVQPRTLSVAVGEGYDPAPD